MKKVFKKILIVYAAACCSVLLLAGNPPLFPTDIKVNGKGELLMTEKGTKRVSLFAADGKTLLRSYSLDDTPTGIALDGIHAYVTTFGTEGGVQLLSLESGKIEKFVKTGSGACSPLISPDGRCVYVCNQFQGTVSEVDLSAGIVRRSVEVLREPKSAVFSRDGNFLFVTNFLPQQRADVNHVSACVSVIRMSDFKKIKDIRLANGSNALRGICLTPDGKYVYVSHNLGRFTVPTSQLQQGWMNTSAFSIIDTGTQEFLGVVIVDEPEQGAAGIWSIVCNEQSIFISHSGTHEISVIDQQAMFDKFSRYPNKAQLDYDLNFLYGIRKRIPLQGNGPRSMVLAGKQLIVPTYFADILNFVDTETGNLTAVDLNPGREETSVHKGERFFNDAANCFQGWQSCNGCHPGDARTDGMNWDLLNDGVGNSKNCKSLLFSHYTPPSMISGIREHAEHAVRAGFKFIQFYEVSEKEALCVDAYLKSLTPVPSPFLIDGKLSEKAQEGKKVFEKLKCDKCHSGPYYTDMSMHRIGADVEFEKGWDTPTLREVWRTAPYLFDGRAATMKEVFKEHKHGIDRKISEKEIDALTEYVNSL